MPFGLKNAGVTYQRAMTALFHDMMHQELEVYVDDMIIKSKRTSKHLTDLKKLFDRLRKYQLKLNPAKCAFGILSGKLLGFMVSWHGIEIDPGKIKAITEMPTPTKEKEIRGFLGRINFISRFISRTSASQSSNCSERAPTKHGMGTVRVLSIQSKSISWTSRS